MLKLFSKPECPFCWKVRLALYELKQSAEIIDHTHSNEWQACTPSRTVPVLLDGTLVIYESNVALEYLNEKNGQLLPPDSAERAQARLLNLYSDSIIGKGLREVIFEKRAHPPAQQNQNRIQEGIQAFHAVLPFLSTQLADKSYFVSQYTFPECALTARFGLARAYGVDIPETFANLVAWFERMQQRPSYAATCPPVAANPTH